MKKKSLRPIQTAPVQRDTTATTSASSCGTVEAQGLDFRFPFAGGDAE
ncbi:anacyclamide/piricyclamide family prenylated cyclic peptide [Lyngbya sp. CCAP 1446/10]|nr:anacyclamide/piricyclamide family prenylated cyclic peptide [Lyngbya sp. CCAP 1446/10]